MSWALKNAFSLIWLRQIHASLGNGSLLWYGCAWGLFHPSKTQMLFGRNPSQMWGKSVIVGAAIVLTISLVSVACRLSNEVALHIYEVEKSEQSIGEVTIGVAKVFYRPAYRAARPVGPVGPGAVERAPDRVVLVGYICNYRDSSVRIYDRSPLSERLVGFSWGPGEEQIVTSMYVQDSRAHYEGDEGGGRVRERSFWIFPHTEHHFNIYGQRRLPSKPLEVVLRMDKVIAEPNGEEWSYQLDVRLGKPRVEDILYYEVDEKYPAFDLRADRSGVGRNSSGSWCSPPL